MSSREFDTFCRLTKLEYNDNIIIKKENEKQRYIIMEKKQILEKINNANDISGLTYEELDLLSSEIREFLIENVSKTGGHLASNLGVVELTLALHRVFDLPNDRIVWDVGHQTYVHKILTGRKERFETLRQGGGLSGFTNRDESEYDCFGAGHSSTSISAALGFSEADKLNGRDSYTVAVVGDGAFTGGMIHEALNNCGNDLRLIIIINENEMSISKNIGRFAKNMAKLRAGNGYLKTKRATRNFVKRIPLIGNGLFRLLRDTKKWFKNIMYGSNYFEDMGLYYLGPVDGHNIASLERLLNEAKSTGKSAVVHVKTVKGKGFEPAENDPGKYHGMAAKNADSSAGGFSSVMGEHITTLADEDKRICAITAAMADGTGLVGFAEKHSERFYDVGIAEEHALTFAAGLAAAGMRPVTAIYSTFLQRGYDNIIHDIALQKLPVVMCIDRAGLNSSDGATHHGIFDVSFLSSIPNLILYTPITNEGLKASINEALASGQPCAVRYPNGKESNEIIERFYADGDFEKIGARSDLSSEGSPKVVIITHGRIVSEALQAEKALAEQGIDSGIILLEKLKPYDECAEKVKALIPESAKLIVFLEEEIRSGGMGMLLSDKLSQNGVLDGRKYTVLAVDDSFVIRDKNEPIYKTAGIDSDSIVEIVKRKI